MTTSLFEKESPELKEFYRLHEEYDEIYNFVTTPYSEEPPVLMDRLSSLNIYLARTGKLYADAEALNSYSIAKRFETLSTKEMSPMIQKEYLKAYSRRTQRLVTLFERLNSTISNQIKALITQLSYIKTEMQSLQH